MLTSTRKLATYFATAALAATGLLAGTAAAQAAPARGGAPVVAFGDSIMANPTPGEYIQGIFAKTAPALPNNLNDNDCATDGTFARTVAATSGIPSQSVKDYSCAGASFSTGGQHFTTAIHTAATKQDLGPHTHTVYLLGGANDTYPRILGQHTPINVIQRDLTGDITKQINHIKSHAPNARIKVVGYPTITNNHGHICYINPTPGPGLTSPTIKPKPVENAVQNAQRDAAARTSTQFVDSKAPSTGHDICAADRWMVGIADAKPHNLPLHMTSHGLTHIARNAARA